MNAMEMKKQAIDDIMNRSRAWAVPRETIEDLYDLMIDERGVVDNAAISFTSPETIEVEVFEKPEEKDGTQYDSSTIYTFRLVVIRTA